MDVTRGDGGNWAVRSSRRSAASMSASETVCLVLYQGAWARWAGHVQGGLTVGRVPADGQAYAQQAERHGALHGVGVRLRACPTPATWRASSNSTSTLHLVA